jgi:hypothetical protein
MIIFFDILLFYLSFYLVYVGKIEYFEIDRKVLFIN